MTRLVEDDVRALTAHLDDVERRLVALTGCGFIALAARACGVGEGVARDALAHATVAAVPVTSGEGLIPGFVDCVTAICARLGCHARVTEATDVAGFAEALVAGDDLVFAADDRRFLALHLAHRVVADDDPCTAHAYAAALDAAAGPGGCAGKPVLVIGLGPVGRAAAARLVTLGAHVPGLRDECRPAGRRHQHAAGHRGLAAGRPGGQPPRARRHPHTRPDRYRLGRRRRHRLFARPATRRHGRRGVAPWASGSCTSRSPWASPPWPSRS